MNFFRKLKTVTLISLFFFIFFSFNTKAKEVKIIAKVNNNIITNVDVENEYNYLITLNTSLKEIDKKQVIKFARESLVKERVKEIEILKFYELNKINETVDLMIENIFKNYLKVYLRYVVILFFGLLHGLGFALVLSDIGYRSTDLLINLISFNIGIEFAQISIILVLYLLIALNFGKNKNYKIYFQVPSSILISSIGLYWFFDRTNFF